MPIFKRVAQPRWLLIIIILIGFGLRIYRLDYQSLRGDEAISAIYSSLPIEETLEISRHSEPHPPLFYLVLHSWLILVGLSEFAVRYWGFLAGVLAIPSLYTLTLRLLGSRVAILAAFLLATNSFHIWHSQDARSYPWLVLLGIWSAIFLWQSLNSSRWQDWAKYTVVLICLFYLHYYAVFLALFHGLYLLWIVIKDKHRSFNLLAQWGMAFLIAIVILIPWIGTSWRFITQYKGNFISSEPVTILWRTVHAFSGGLTSEVPSFSVWVVPAVLVAIWGIWFIWRARRDVAVFILLFLGTTLAGVMILSLRGQAFTERYTIGAQPAFPVLGLLCVQVIGN